MNIIEKTYDWASDLLIRRATDMLVLHHAAVRFASPDDVHAFHISNGWSGIGYHFYIRKDGAVYRCRPENTVGAHTKGFNSASIGICFEGNFENESMTSAQTAAGAELIGYLRSKYGILVIREHRDLAATACPGKFFRLDAILNYQPSVKSPECLPPSGWAEDACKWALDCGIIRGDGLGNTDWQSQVTLERVLTILHRFSLKSFGI